jgi:hypothetical protein
LGWRVIPIKQKDLLTETKQLFTPIYMKNTLRLAVLTAITLASSLAMADSGAKGSNNSDAVADEALAVPDILFVRPVGLAGCALGFTAFVVTSPFTAMAECVDESWDTLVVTPGEWTFVRSLGDFGDSK